MINKVVLAESKAKVGTLEGILGGEYTCLHLCPQLDFSRLNKIPDKISIYDAYSLGEADQAHLLKSLQGVHEIYLAYDPSPKGEALSYAMKKLCYSPGSKIKRLWLTSLKKKSVLAHLEKPQKIDRKLAGRFLLAQFTHYLIRKEFFAAYQRGNIELNWLELYVLLQIDSYHSQSKPAEQEIVGEFQNKDNQIGARLTAIKGSLPELVDINFFKALLIELENRQFRVTQSEESVLNISAPPLFNLASLMEDAAQTLNLSCAETERLVYQLYHGSQETETSIGFPLGSIPWPIGIDRQKLRERIMSDYGLSCVSNNNTRSPREPCNNEFLPASLISPRKLRSAIGSELYPLYDLIWSRTLASEMCDVKIQVRKTIITDDRGDFVFESIEENYIDRGFHILYGSARLSKGEGCPLNPGVRPRLIKVKLRSLAKKSSLMSWLLKACSQIARNDTTAIALSVAKLERLELIRFSQGEYDVTNSGLGMVKHIQENNPELFDNGFVTYLNELFEKMAMGDFSAKQAANEVGKLRQITKSTGAEKKSPSSYDPCPMCGGLLVERSSKFGRFLACRSFPKCHFTKPISIGVKCPQLGCGGDVIERRTKNNKLFYGCSEYPQCHFSSWEKPVNIICPECHNLYLVKRGSNIKCPSCSFSMVKKSMNVTVGRHD